MNKKNIYALVITILLVSLIFTFINNKNKKIDVENKEKLSIVTTFYPINIMIRNITKDAKDIEVVNLAEQNTGCIHNYTLSTSDMKKIEKADILIENGMGLESFIEKAINLNRDIKIIDSSENITNTINKNDEINPHIWTSVENNIAQVQNIGNKLIEIDSKNKEIYIKNVDEYTNKLMNLRNKYAQELEKLKNTKVICLDESISYLAKEIGLDVFNIEKGHDENNLSAEEIKKITNMMKEENIKIILVEKDEVAKEAKILEKETGAKIYALESGLYGEYENDAYIKIMENNLETLKEIKEAK